jgi:DNA-binding Lrp family transcriptional regulator
VIRKKDRILLKELIEDSRLKIVDLAERTGLTRQSVYSKIHNLRKNGVNFTVDINPEYLGLNLKAYILIQAEPNSDVRKKLTENIKKLREVSQLHYILGRYDIIAEVILKDRNQLKKILKKFQSWPAIKKTETFIVYDTVKFNLKDPFIVALTVNSSIGNP